MGQETDSDKIARLEREIERLRAENERLRRALEEALRAATEAPLDIMRACAEAIGHASVVATYGNTNASSDVRVGLELLGAGLRGARLNVEVNLASMKDPAFIANVRSEADRLAGDAESGHAAALAVLESPGH